MLSSAFRKVSYNTIALLQPAAAAFVTSGGSVVTSCGCIYCCKLCFSCNQLRLHLLLQAVVQLQGSVATSCGCIYCCKLWFSSNVQLQPAAAAFIVASCGSVAMFSCNQLRLHLLLQAVVQLQCSVATSCGCCYPAFLVAASYCRHNLLSILRCSRCRM